MREPLAASTVVAVIGAGTMGAGIAQVAASAGHRVLLHDSDPEAIERGIRGVAQGLERRVQRGRLSRSDADTLLERLAPAAALDDLSAAGLVIEAIVEDLAVKRQLIARLEAICPADAIFASNTSSLSLTALAAGFDCRARIAGMHFFNPAPVMQLVEIVTGLDTDPAVAGLLHATAAAWGKQPVMARSTPGFIVNRVARPFYGEALRLLEEGAADFPVIDEVVRRAGGFRMGPFELMDLIGIDVNYAVSRSVYDAYYQDPRYLPSLLQKERVEAGRLGRKSGRGFYDYDAPRSSPDAAPVDPAQLPSRLGVHGDIGPLATLVQRLEQAGIAVENHDEGDGVVTFGHGALALSDGRTATRRGFEELRPDLVLIDLALDYGSCDALAVAPARGCSDAALAGAIALLDRAGIAAYVIDDTPALVVLRLLLMLINEAADAVLQGVCDCRGVDAAMRGGVNYPRGPLAWADAIGLDRVYTAINHLQQAYGSDRYRPSLLLQQHVYAEEDFHG